MKIFFTLFLCSLSFYCVSCSNERSEPKSSVTLNVTDFSASIDENPAQNQIIGKINAQTNTGSLKFEIASQSQNGSFNINPSTGELSVSDRTVFDYEINQKISGVVKVSNGNISKNCQIDISVKDISETTVSINDFTFNINENPTNQMVIGKISATTNAGSLSYSIESQSLNDALKIDATTGNLSVLTRNLFDFEINPILTAIVKATNNGISAVSNVKINLRNLNFCDEENANMENYFADFINTGSYMFQTTMDTRTHEYTFHVSETLNLCSIGYQSYTEKPCVIEIVNENNTVIYSNIFTFSKTYQDYKDLPLINLQPNKNYTVRRRFENYNNTSDLIGKLFQNKNSTSSIVPFNTGKIVITQARYYDNYNSNIVTSSIPYITFGYSLP